jgi:hypothetical protein
MLRPLEENTWETLEDISGGTDFLARTQKAQLSSKY